MHLIRLSNISGSTALPSTASPILTAASVSISTLRVIYISTWPTEYQLYEPFENHLQNIISAVQFAFPEMSDSIEGYTKEELEQFLKQQPKHSMLLILDDWNRISRFRTERCTETEVINFFTTNCFHQYFVYGISAAADFLKEETSSKPAFQDRMYMYGGLSDQEFDQWITRSPFDKFGPPLVPNEKLDEFKYYTGMVPFFLKRLSTFPSNTYDEMMEWWRVLTDQGGGEWISRQVGRHFCEEICNMRTDAQKNEYIEYMIKVIELPRGYDVPTDKYNHQMFSSTEPGVVPKLVTPICGMVVYALSRALEKINVATLKASLTNDWIARILQSQEINPSVKDLMFETYCLHKIAKLMSLGDLSTIRGFSTKFLTVKVIRFPGNFPVISDDDVLNWPEKWNLHYVDMVIRLILSEQFEEFTGTGRGRKRRMWSENVLYLFAVQVTLQSPLNHAQTLNFFNPASCHDGKPDCQRYLIATDHAYGENICFHIVWMVPSTLANPVMPVITFDSPIPNTNLQVRAVNHIVQVTRLKHLDSFLLLFASVKNVSRDSIALPVQPPPSYCE